MKLELIFRMPAGLRRIAVSSDGVFCVSDVQERHTPWALIPKCAIPITGSHIDPRFLYWGETTSGVGHVGGLLLFLLINTPFPSALCYALVSIIVGLRWQHSRDSSVGMAAGYGLDAPGSIRQCTIFGGTR
jgi:hypothetical protein